VFLVNAAHVKNVPGRKTDPADARWLAKRMRYGLLQASVIPPAEPRELRDLTRYRAKLGQERRREVNRVQGVLERAHITLASGTSDIMGVSGRAILAALSEGRADPATMAELAKGRLRRTIPVLEQALTGLMRDHHWRLLALQVAHMDFLDEQLDTLSAAIACLLSDLSAAPPALARGTRGSRRRGERVGVDRPCQPPDLCAGGHGAGHHSRGEAAGWGALGGRVGDRHGPVGHRRASRGVERCGPWERRKCRQTTLRQDPDRQSGSADRSDATGPCRRADQGDLWVGLVSSAGRAGARNAPSWPWHTRSWSVPAICSRAMNRIMNSEPPPLMTINGSIWSIASHGVWSTWAIAAAANRYQLYNAVFSP
jgi:hypothetical protein